MHRESHEWWSPALGRPMRLLWYGREGRPILIFPTSMGHESQTEDLGLIGGVGDLIERVARVRRGRRNAGVLDMIIPRFSLPGYFSTPRRMLC